MFDNRVSLLEMILKLSILASCAALSMTAQEPVRPNLDGFKYPVIARSAAIQGTVEFAVKSDGIQLISGPPMLVAAAKSNLETWAVRYTSDTPLFVTYIFRLKESGTQIIEVDRPIGNSFDRFFLRLFRRPITRRIKKEDCVYSRNSLVGFEDAMKDGQKSIDIDIQADRGCLETNTVAIAALRH